MDGGDDEQDNHDDRDEELRRLELPERPALIYFINAIHSPTERADVPGRRPDGQHDATDQRKSGGGRSGDLFDRPTDHVGGIARSDLVDDAQHGVPGGLPLPDDAE